MTQSQRSSKLSNKDSSSQPEQKKYVIFIGCIPGSVTNQDVLDQFQQYGEIFDLRIRKKKGNLGSGYGTFCTYSKATFDQLVGNPQKLLGRKITCREFLQGKKKGEFLKSLHNRRIYLKNVPIELSDEDIFSIFKKYGKIERAYAIRDLEGTSLGYGYVNFSSVEEAKKMLQEQKEVIVAAQEEPILCLPYSKSEMYQNKNQTKNDKKKRKSKKKRLVKKNSMPLKNFQFESTKLRSKRLKFISLNLDERHNTRRLEKNLLEEMAISRDLRPQYQPTQFFKPTSFYNRKTLPMQNTQEQLNEPQEKHRFRTAPYRFRLPSINSRLASASFISGPRPAYLENSLLQRVNGNHCGYNLRLNKGSRPSNRLMSLNMN